MEPKILWVLLMMAPELFLMLVFCVIAMYAGIYLVRDEARFRAHKRARELGNQLDPHGYWATTEQVRNVTLHVHKGVREGSVIVVSPKRIVVAGPFGGGLTYKLEDPEAEDHMRLLFGGPH